VAGGEPASGLVRAGAVQEVARHGAGLGAPCLAPVEQLRRIPAGVLVHAPADVAGGQALAVAECGEVGAEQDGVGAVALHLLDVVVDDVQPHRRLEHPVEREVHVAGRQHDGALHRVRGGEGEHQSTGPVGDAARAVGDAGGAGRERAGQAHGEVGARGRGDAHRAGAP
jgi:hypothetical protein